MDESDVQLLIIPGIGEDERLSYPQIGLPYRLIRPRYMAPHDNESLSTYCRRFAEELAPKLDFSRPLFLMGASLGAAVVQELSRHLPATGIILISCYRSSGELYPLYRFFGRHVAMKIPLFLYQLGSLFAKNVIGYLTNAPEHDLNMCAKMYASFPKAWFRRHAKMGAEWKGCKVTTPSIRIHGTLDPLIPFVDQKDIDIVIKDDKHMCNLSEKETVNEEISRFVSRLMLQKLQVWEQRRRSA